MNDTQFELLLEALNRIAKALEDANLRDFQPPTTVWVTPQPAPPVAYPTAPNGYTCGRCGVWIRAGNAHACGNTWGVGG